MGARRVAYLLALVSLPFTSASGRAAPWDVADTARAGQWTIYNRVAGGANLGLPVAIGDLDGDGRGDVVVAPMNADSGPDGTRSRAGAVAIALGGELEGILDLAALDPGALPARVTLVYGADALDLLGTQVTVADLDGDGYGDAVLGAQNADGPGNARIGAGEVAVLWGGPAFGGRVVDLADPGAGAVTLIYGAAAGDRAGTWVGAGDFDGDGTTDLLVGADQASGPDGSRHHAGATYVLYGGTALRAQPAIDLASSALEATIIDGVDAEDHSGATVRGFDVDRDGVDDLLIGAGVNRLSSSIDDSGESGAHAFAGGDGPANERDNAGEAYVVFGTRGGRPARIDLRTPPASTAVVYGVDPGDTWGEEINAGDFDGDGRVDLVVGALTADGPANARGNAGEAALILGVPGFRGRVVDLASPPAGVTFFEGAIAGEIAGDTALLTDLDSDGRDDLVVGRPGANPGVGAKAGATDVFFGRAEPLPGRIDLGAPPAEWLPLAIAGGSAGDILAYSGAAGDVDGDGFADIVLNGMGADGFGDFLPGAGEVYVLSGARLAEAHGQPEATPTETPSATASRTASATALPSDTPQPSATATASPSATATAPPGGSGGCAMDPAARGPSWPAWLAPALLGAALGRGRRIGVLAPRRRRRA